MEKRYGKIGLFGNLKVLCFSAILAAISAVFGKLLAIPIGNSLRISVENLPIILSGICFGPGVGACVGLVADLIGCLIKGYSIIPLVTLGSVCVGLFSGIAKSFIKKEDPFGLYVCTGTAHFFGNIIVKTIALHLVYSTPFSVLVWRLPIYIGTAAVEGFIIILLFNFKPFKQSLERIKHK